MSRSTDPLAEPKAIGEDIEQLVVDAVDGLRAAVDPEDWYDAHVETTIGPRTAEDVIFASISLLEAGTLVEIKACKRRVSNGTRNRDGLWTFQVDQHEKLVKESAVYLLAIYDDVGGTKQLEEIVVSPASIVDECLIGRWYDVDRHEGRVAQLGWPHVLGDQEVSADAE
ncbi:hypothetical protein [Salinibaculum salinum]|uniref:hypothetical protein n=1 Tax=Salinibaculum salinum TaxID=3131996 RepID=UPI0030EF6EDF